MFFNWNFKIITKTHLLILAVVFSLLSGSLAYASSKVPAPDSVPQLKYIAIKTVFPNFSDITNAENTEEVLLKLREISSLTANYHLELLEVLKSTPYIEFENLNLIADAVYFSSQAYDGMIEMLNDPRACVNDSIEKCRLKIERVKSNIQSAQKFGDYSNQILLQGLPKLNQVTTEEAYTLLSKSFQHASSVELLFQNVLKEIDNLSDKEKINFMKLAILKSADQSAVSLALDWFKLDSSKTFDELITLASEFPSLSNVRDEVLSNAMVEIQSLNLVQAKKIISLSLDQRKIAQITLSKIEEMSAHDLAQLASVCKLPEDKDLLILAGIKKIKTATSSEAVELIEQTSKNKIKIANALISLITDLKVSDLVLIAETSTYAEDRVEIISSNIGRFTSLNASEARSLADQVVKNKVAMVLMLMPKVPALTAMDLAHIAESIGSGPERDHVLLDGVKLVQSADVPGITAVLNLAYNSKLEVTTALFPKVTNFTALDLALIAKNCLNPATRDQILIQGSNSVRLTSLEGAIALVNQASQEKVKVTLAVLSQMPEASTTDLGLILKVIADGATRDRIIDSSLQLLKKFSGDGAALIVERSFDNKVPNAIKLINLIPMATGTDLFKILSVCGSGNTRDLILADTVKSLGKLSKEEAKNLYTKAYNNKESVAILLISKIDDVDGSIIGEIALLSGKASTRDLIITEGLKRIKTMDVKGLIAMIRAADKLTERLVLEVSSSIKYVNVDSAVEITNVILSIPLRDRFLLHAIDLVLPLDEPAITSLASLASGTDAKEAIIKKGLEKMDEDL